MQIQLIIGLVIVVLVILFIYLKKAKGHKESNLPAVSEDVNLPMASNPTPPATNELDNNGSQQ